MIILNNKKKTTIIAGVMIMLVLVMPSTVLPNANAFAPLTWSKVQSGMQAKPAAPNNLIYYEKVSPLPCTNAATTGNQCIGTDTSFGLFTYKAPGGYGIPATCGYPCENQDVIVEYPNNIVINDVTYAFDYAEQQQCTQDDIWCSNWSPQWSSSSPVSVPYGGTPVGDPITIDTPTFYTDGTNTVEIEFTYDLNSGYDYG